jgi:hypothetical protein
MGLGACRKVPARQLPLAGLDGIHHAVALGRADQKLVVGRDIDIGQGLDEFAEARGVNGDTAEQALILHQS